MIELKIEYPYVDSNGRERFDLIKHYAKDENGMRYNVRQLETDALYVEAIDIYPCKYTYEATEDIVENGYSLEEESVK